MLVNTKPIKMLLRAPKLFACMVCLGLFMLIYIWYSFYSGVQKEKSAATEQAYQKTANMASIFKEHAERSLEHADLVTSFWQKTYRKYGKASIGFAKLIGLHLIVNRFIQVHTRWHGTQQNSSGQY